MDYAIIRLGGKQYRVREGEYLVVDRVKVDEGATFNPDVLLGDTGVTVTAKVVAHERGPKIRIGKYRRRTGYRRHNGFRAATSRIEFSLGAPAQKDGPAKTEAAAEATAPPAPPETVAPASPAPSETSETAAAPAPATDEQVTGMPSGYDELTVSQIAEGAKTWDSSLLEAALEYEQAHAARKGAISALQSALKAKEETS